MQVTTTTTRGPSVAPQATLVPAPNTVYVQQPYNPPVVYVNFASKLSLILGLTQICAGTLLVIFNIWLLCIQGTGSYVAAGIWSAPLIILAGSFGIAAARKRTKCPIVTTMVFSILVPICCAVIVGVHIWGAACDGSSFCYEKWDYKDWMDKDTTRVVLHSLMVIIALTVGIIAIVHAGLCCNVMCCGRRETTILPQSMPMGYNRVVSPVVAGHTIQTTPQGQTIVYVAQPGPGGVQNLGAPMVIQGTPIQSQQPQYQISATPPPAYQPQAPNIQQQQVPHRVNQGYTGEQANQNQGSAGVSQMDGAQGYTPQAGPVGAKM